MSKMKPIKAMIEAVEYMAESGKCDNMWVNDCENCPGHDNAKDRLCDCIDGWSNTDLKPTEFDKTLQTSAKNWLKENGVNNG